MKRWPVILLVIVFAGLFCAESAARQKGERFAGHTVLYRAEKKAGCSFIFCNVNSSDSEFLLLTRNIDAQGRLFRFTPGFEIAYADNAAIGARIGYTFASLDLPSTDLELPGAGLSLGIKDAGLNVSALTATVFHRNYIGLSASGTVGFFLEESARFACLSTTTNGGISDRTYKAMLSISPGLMLYILPMVSLEFSLAVADLGFVRASATDGTGGSRWQVRSTMGLDILNLNFGINYHF